MCILCKSIVRSEDVWKVHINAKQHRQNIEQAKKLKESTNNFTVAPPTLKRSASSPPPPTIIEDQPFKKPKGILKNSTKVTSSTTTTQNVPNKNATAIPDDFFDAKPSTSSSSASATAKSFFEATLQKTSIRKDLINIKQRVDKDATSSDNDGNAMMDIDSATDEKLPEGFFDDPIKDAKARNLDYKDPIEEEWEKFQKEIKAASNFSNAIIAEDQEEATTERQIDEIDEQIRNWTR